jgi:predicted O-methyltransferase YrrM
VKPLPEKLAAGVLRVCAWAIAPVGALIARTGIGSNKCLDRGFLPIPIHFYQPIFDHRQVPSSVWEGQHDLPGLDFREDEQLTLLEGLGEFGHECGWPRSGRPEEGYFWENPMFGYTSACLLHAMVRTRRPARIVEIGAGMSTLVFLSALGANGAGTLVSVDPNPSSFLSALDVADHVIVNSPVQEVSSSIFDDADFVFVDSSHVVRTGGDVNTIYLDVLPRLRSGTTVHVHDVYLPFEYPKTYSERERSRYFWNEQYILQAFLAMNDSYRIDLAGYWAQQMHPAAFSHAFPGFDPQQHRATSSIYLSRV